MYNHNCLILLQYLQYMRKQQLTLPLEMHFDTCSLKGRSLQAQSVENRAIRHSLQHHPSTQGGFDDDAIHHQQMEPQLREHTICVQDKLEQMLKKPSLVQMSDSFSRHLLLRR